MVSELQSKLFLWKYQCSMLAHSAIRSVQDLPRKQNFSSERTDTPLPVVIHKHKSLIRRKLGDVDMQLQENKAVNLQIAAKEITGIRIRPREEFSLWHLVGNCTPQKGYLPGLTLCGDKMGQDIGGGLCQLSNLIHWMVLHSALDISEQHHHDGCDLFPDNDRKLPFGCGTSILYNYKDYRFINFTDRTYQLIIYTNDTYLCGELRADSEEALQYHIEERDAYFTLENGTYYRNNTIYKHVYDKASKAFLGRHLLRRNHARVLYDEKYIPADKIYSRDKSAPACKKITS